MHCQTPDATPRPCHVRVWHAATSTDQRGEFERRCERWLAEEELIHADRFQRTTTRNQHVVGRAMARRLLADRNVAPEAIRFGTGRHGKPQVVTPDEAIQPFNIAHTDGLVLCGVADPHVDLVGVDVESIHRRTSTELAERYFAEPEVRFLRRQPLARQQYFFLRIWTLKEAFIKAIGTGLHTPLADFAFEQIDSERPVIRFLAAGLDLEKQWSFVCSTPREGFIASAAVGVTGSHSPALVQWQPFENLVGGPANRSNVGDEL
ncbi:4'-phosphopantetheinyl transferase sfp [Stieleria neptunia]|uniref:4'-phosphopantetheinyl transferase sfp n=1 Tax=Stieleria neptunia TaxID=2527979 RepID=A0A518HPA7_9BACT|nr:4'-phosphopantetheinyl transferase superfamily protein [Stieleria neptunia]QDV42675.1 4'-phosphopantetheinyl transferase sfp [Stieleria neptunia]